MVRPSVTIFSVLTLASLLLAVGPKAAEAVEFNPNSIISDRDLTDGSAMSDSRVQVFLTQKSGAIASLTFQALGTMKTAAQIIYEAGNFYSISQKVLLVILQKEQSLVTHANPDERRLDWATGFGVCDSCSKDDPAIQKFKGFFNQVNWAARQIREGYLADLVAKGVTISGWGPGVTKVTDEGDAITPTNNATAALYTYTPHVNGNRTFWQIWNGWFVRKYPDGSLLQKEKSPVIYLIQNGLKRPFATRSAFRSRFSDYRLIIPVTQNDLDVYDSGPPIKFSNFTLVELPTGERYLLVADTKRLIESDEVFRTLGFNPEEIIPAAPQELGSYSAGTPLTLSSAYPTGALLQVKETGGIAYVEAGVRHAIWSREIFRSRFRNRKLIKVTQAELDQYTRGEPVKFLDGEIVTSPNAGGVYVISNGQRRGIPSPDVFRTLGYRWKNLIRTTDQVLEIHPVGEPISLGD